MTPVTRVMIQLETATSPLLIPTTTLNLKSPLHAVVPMANTHFGSSQASWHHHRHLSLPLPLLRDVGIRGLCHAISIDGGLSTAGVSTAGVSTADVSTAGISTAGVSTAGVSMAGVSMVSTVGYQWWVYQRRAIDGGHINGGLSTAGVSMAGGLSMVGVSMVGVSTVGYRWWVIDGGHIAYRWQAYRQRVYPVGVSDSWGSVSPNMLPLVSRRPQTTVRQFILYHN